MKYIPTFHIYLKSLLPSFMICVMQHNKMFAYCKILYNCLNSI